MIYICYGITKTASTYLYQITEELLRTAGRRPVRLGPPFRQAISVDNYFDYIDGPLLKELASAAAGRDLVLKTHGLLSPDIASLIAAGDVKASATIRDPREIALSMLDHGRLSQQGRAQIFTEFETLADTVAALDLQIPAFRQWAQTPGTLVLTYNDICFDTEAVVGRIADQLGLNVAPKKVLKPLSNRLVVGQFNRGAPYRYREMAAEDQAFFLARYEDLYRDYDLKGSPAARQAASHLGSPVGRGRDNLGSQLSHGLRFIRDRLR